MLDYQVQWLGLSQFLVSSLLHATLFMPSFVSSHASHLVTGSGVVIVPVNVDTSSNVWRLLLQSHYQ